jgi:hypothetical protein
MTKKKDKKSIEKRRAKAQEKKRATRASKSKQALTTQVVKRPPMADIEAPLGFRTVSFSQASMEYMKPLMDDGVVANMKELNELATISSSLWNYTIDLEEGKSDSENEAKILGQIKIKLSMNDQEARELFQKMIDRKRHLFPTEIQPKALPFMFIRKELSHVIAPFNYGGLSFSAEPIPPDDHDQEAIEKITRMDRHIIEGTDYDEWEDFYFSMEEAVCDRFENWLNEKGATEQSQGFASNLELFLNFVYRYAHDDLVTPKAIPPRYLDEFFFDYLLRKLVTEPHEYVAFTPTLKLFFRFLHEKLYLPDAWSAIQCIDKMEPEFINVLRKRFG